MNDGTQPLLKVVGIVKKFPGVTALAGVDLDLYPGEVHVLVGENGAGKSTLVKIISGLYSPDKGEIYLGGRQVRMKSPRQALASGISTIYQEQLLVPELTIAENIFLGREPKERFPSLFIDRKRMEEETEELLGRVGLRLKPGMKVSQVSLAGRQLIAIAKALSMEVRVLILDEPTSPLTDVETETLFKVIGQLKERGVGLIYITHRLDEARVVGDRITIFRDGMKVYSGTASETALDQVIRYMIGREVVEFFPKEELEPGPEVMRATGLTRGHLFKDVSFSLRAGEILGMFGLMGSGINELIRCLYGLEPLEDGGLWLNGGAAAPSSPREAIASGMAFLPSDRKGEGLVPPMMVRSNISLSRLKAFTRAGVLNLRGERQVAREFMGRLRIKAPSDRSPVRTLSGGNQQKVVLAKSLCQQARLLIFDEPTRGIDVGAKVEIFKEMNDLARQGAGIIMVSSELDELVGMCDRILVIHGGKIVAQYSRGQFSQEEIMKRAFGKPELVSGS